MQQRRDRSIKRASEAQNASTHDRAHCVIASGVDDDSGSRICHCSSSVSSQALKDANCYRGKAPSACQRDEDRIGVCCIDALQQAMSAGHFTIHIAMQPEKSMLLGT